MKYILSLVLACLVSPAYASVLNPSAAGLACTRDINEWGQSRHCDCNDMGSYEPRIGLCLSDAPEAIMVQGRINMQDVAIGAETTGVALEGSEAGRFELQLPLALKARLERAERIALPFEIQGDLVIIPGIEGADRKIIIVNDLFILE